MHERSRWRPWQCLQCTAQHPGRVGQSAPPGRAQSGRPSCRPACGRARLRHAHCDLLARVQPRAKHLPRVVPGFRPVVLLRTQADMSTHPTQPVFRPVRSRAAYTVWSSPELFNFTTTCMQRPCATLATCCCTLLLLIPSSSAVTVQGTAPAKRSAAEAARTWAAYSRSWASSGSTRATSDSVVAVASLYGFRAMSNPRSFVGSSLARARRRVNPAFRLEHRTDLLDLAH